MSTSDFERKPIEVIKAINGLEKVVLREIYGSRVEVSKLISSSCSDLSILLYFRVLREGAVYGFDLTRNNNSPDLQTIDYVESVQNFVVFYDLNTAIHDNLLLFSRILSNYGVIDVCFILRIPGNVKLSYDNRV